MSGKAKGSEAPAAGSVEADCAPFDDGGCGICFGRGYVVTCIDDMCHGQEECIHGDGESICPECGSAA